MPEQLEQIVATHTTELSQIRDSMSGLHDDISELDQKFDKFAVVISDLSRSIASLQATGGTIQTSTLLKTVGTILTVIGISWGVLTWFQGRHEVNEQRLKTEIRQLERGNTAQNIAQLRQEFKEHVALDGHPTALRLHTRTDERLSGHGKELEQLRHTIKDEIEAATQRLDEQIDLKIKAMVNDRFTSKDALQLLSNKGKEK